MSDLSIFLSGAQIALAFVLAAVAVLVIARSR
jgi:hypothetical protein